MDTINSYTDEFLQQAGGISAELMTLIENRISQVDSLRYAYAGGYPSAWDARVVDGVPHILIATLGGSDYNEPELKVVPTAEFLERYPYEDFAEDLVDEEEDES